MLLGWVSIPCNIPNPFDMTEVKFCRFSPNICIVAACFSLLASMLAKVAFFSLSSSLAISRSWLLLRYALIVLNLSFPSNR